MKNTIIAESRCYWNNNKAVNRATKKILRIIREVKGTEYEVKGRKIEIAI